ncbi:MAG: hypothetical protein HQM13_18125 [SAR324 cluster bacterium]|nr:hypothetical protein [SAR324 cluster bacterium]
MKRKFTFGLCFWGVCLTIFPVVLNAQSEPILEPIFSSPYQLIDGLTEEVQGKTKTAWRIIVSGSLTQSSLARILRHAHFNVLQEIQNQSKIAAHVVIWAYISKLHLHSKELWLAALEQKGKNQAHIRFNHDHLNTLHSPPTTLHQLSEESRKLVWQELQELRKKSQLEAQALFPLNGSELNQARQFFRLTKQTTLLLADPGAIDPPAEMTGAVNLPPDSSITLQASISLKSTNWHFFQAVLPLEADPVEGWIDSLDLSRQTRSPDQEYHDQIHELTKSIQYGYQSILAEKNSLSSQQLDDILLEGILKNWPLAEASEQ